MRKSSSIYQEPERKPDCPCTPFCSAFPGNRCPEEQPHYPGIPGREKNDAGFPTVGQKVSNCRGESKNRFYESETPEQEDKSVPADTHPPAGEPAERSLSNFLIVVSLDCADYPAGYLILLDKVWICRGIVISLCLDAGSSDPDNPVDDIFFIAGQSKADNIADSRLLSLAGDDIQQIGCPEYRVHAGPGIHNRDMPGPEQGDHGIRKLT